MGLVGYACVYRNDALADWITSPQTSGQLTPAVMKKIAIYATPF